MSEAIIAVIERALEVKQQYQDWIHAYEKTHNPLWGRCQSATEEMVKVFPELTRVPGFVGWLGRREEHWWCTTPDGDVVDPTALQFREQGAEDLVYEVWEPGMTIRVGKCMDCGNIIYANPMTLGGDREPFCNKECQDTFQAYLEAPHIDV